LFNNNYCIFNKYYSLQISFIKLNNKIKHKSYNKLLIFKKFENTL
jgi:hypothetical protein